MIVKHFKHILYLTWTTWMPSSNLKTNLSLYPIIQLFTTEGVSQNSNKPQDPYIWTLNREDGILNNRCLSVPCLWQCTIEHFDYWTDLKKIDKIWKHTSPWLKDGVLVTWNHCWELHNVHCCLGSSSALQLLKTVVDIANKKNKMKFTCLTASTIFHSHFQWSFLEPRLALYHISA